MNIKTLSAAAVLALTGCVDASPVMPTGKNSYMVSVVSHSQWNEAIIKANTEASDYCASMGKKMVIIETNTQGTQFMSSSSARVQFSCFAEDDPNYKPSTLRPDKGINN